MLWCMSGTRAFDVVVFGATGFTGKLIAEYLARHAGEHVRWAIAGRSRSRLQAVKNRLRELDLAVERVGVIEADKNEPASLNAMVQQSKVILTTVGPYVLGGDALVQACIHGGADYVDITGEPEFVQAIVERYDQPARDSGVRIVHCCGFDSIPTDLGVLYTVSHLPSECPMQVDGFIEVEGTFSGGTWRSAIEAMGGARKNLHKWVQKQLRKTRSRSRPSPRRVRISNPRMRYDRQMNGWVYPLPTIDPLIVRRSAQALDIYGPDFCYSHHAVSSLEAFAKRVLGVGALIALAQFGPTRRKLLDYRRSGEGPTAEQRASSWFKATFIGTAGGTRVVTCVSGGDPGYDETAKMVSESALCLALDDLPVRAGVVTTAEAMGQPLIERLHLAGIRFDVIEQA